MGRWDGVRISEGSERKAEDRVREVRETTLKAVAEEIATIQVKNTVIKQEVQHVVTEKPVYRDGTCQHDATTFELLNSALANKEAAARAVGVGAGQLPTTDPIDR
jgi:non-homologous end joining protein Ku